MEAKLTVSYPEEMDFNREAILEALKTVHLYTTPEGDKLEWANWVDEGSSVEQFDNQLVIQTSDKPMAKALESLAPELSESLGIPGGHIEFERRKPGTVEKPSYEDRETELAALTAKELRSRAKELNELHKDVDFKTLTKKAQFMDYILEHEYPNEDIGEDVEEESEEDSEEELSEE